MRAAAIDTHALVWHLMKPARLGRSARRWLKDADAGRVEIFIPSIVGVELALLVDAGRRVVGPSAMHTMAAAQPAFRVTELGLDEALEFSLLVGITDPFDRMIVACARTRGVPLITADERVRSSALVETIWE